MIATSFKARTMAEMGAPTVFFLLLQGINFLEEAGVRSGPGAPFDGLDAAAAVAGGVPSKNGLTYDEDCHLIWIPPEARFDEMFTYPMVSVKAIDPESALLSKAVKAREKNKILIREAIASDQFPHLAERIAKHGGDLEYFAHD